MLLPDFNRDEMIPVADFRACAFHRDNPSGHYAGCTCGGSFSYRKATPEEAAENRRARLQSQIDSLRKRLASAETELRATGGES